PARRAARTRRAVSSAASRATASWSRSARVRRARSARSTLGRIGDDGAIIGCRRLQLSLQHGGEAESTGLRQVLAEVQVEQASADVSAVFAKQRPRLQRL